MDKLLIYNGVIVSMKTSYIFYEKNIENKMIVLREKKIVRVENHWDF